MGILLIAYSFSRPPPALDLTIWVDGELKQENDSMKTISIKETEMLKIWT